MQHADSRTIEEFIAAYKNGQRHFVDWDFDEGGSLQGMNLREVCFESCFLFLDFSNAVLTNSAFVQCNIKTADFSGANLKDATIKNCSVESTLFTGANTENLTFEDNYFYGATISQDDFERIFK